MFLIAFYLLLVCTDCICTGIPIRHAHIDLLPDHSYLPAHLQNQLNLGVKTSDLMTCIYLCQNEDYCRTAVFNQSALQCTLSEECSTLGRIVSQIGSTLISFLVCDGEPQYLAFSPPLKPVLLATVLSNMTNITVIPSSTTYDIVMMGNYLYMPQDNTNRFKIYDRDTYTPLNDFIFPSFVNGTFYRLDRTGTFCYLNGNRSAFSLYSSLTGEIQTTNTIRNASRICFSTSFVVVINSNFYYVDVYLRATNNLSAMFAYSILLMPSQTSAPCVILNDQLLILISNVGGSGRIQSIILNLTTPSNVQALTAPTSVPVIGRSTVNIDAAGRIYTQTNGSYALVVYSTSGQMLGRLPGIAWLEVAGKASKYKYQILMGATVFEYQPSP